MVSAYSGWVKTDEQHNHTSAVYNLWSTYLEHEPAIDAPMMLIT